MVPAMNENISLQERARATSAYCDKYLSPITSEYDDLSTESRAKFVNSVAFALNDDQPLLATAQVTDRSNKSVEFAIFTKTRVLYFKGHCEKNQQPAIQVVPRRTLKKITVLNSPAVIEGGRHLDGHAQFQLIYDNGVDFELNARHSSSDSFDEINQLLTALYEDLEA